MHLYLIGFRGSGKTTVGERLSKTLALPLIDTDRLIEQQSGRTIEGIFSDGGESAFRDLEQSVIASVSLQNRSVVSLGGGAILREANQKVISETGNCVWLTGSPQVHFERIRSDKMGRSSRPKLTDHDEYAEVGELMRKREPIYRKLADLEINTDELSPDDVEERVQQWIKSLA